MPCPQIVVVYKINKYYNLAKNKAKKLKFSTEEHHEYSQGLETGKGGVPPEGRSVDTALYAIVSWLERAVMH